MAAGKRARGNLRTDLVKLVRYAAVSTVFSIVSFAALAVLVGIVDFPAAWANFLIVAITIPPAFELNRRWVWPHHTGAWWGSPQIIPFAGFSFAALALSTLAVHIIGVEVAHWSRRGRTLSVEVASFGSFGILWLVEYFVLDRMLFRQSPAHGGDYTNSR